MPNIYHKLFCGDDWYEDTACPQCGSPVRDGYFRVVSRGRLRYCKICKITFDEEGLVQDIQADFDSGYFERE